VRRGSTILEVIALRGLTDEAHLAHLLGLLKVHRRPREEPPLVKVDRDGPVGWAVYSCLRAHEDARGEAQRYEVVGVRSGERSFRNPDKFVYVRDELWWELAEWIKLGGAIPEDAKLAQELHAPTWTEERPRLKLTPKSELRRILDRSPDRADACALAVWEPAIHREEPRRPAARTARGDADDEFGASGEINPYSGGIDPYAGLA